MKLTLIKDYANYFNRVIKRENYATIIGNNTYKVLNSINFIPGDDVRTSQIINWSENWDPNYLLVSDDGSTEIKSRWYVIDHTRTRKGQYILILKRDVIADNYDNIIQSPAYIQKAMLTNANDPAIFNNENILTNQIKQWERPIMEIDSTSNEVSPYNWIVGYCNPQKSQANDWASEDIVLYGGVETYSSLNDFPYKYLFDTSNISNSKKTFFGLQSYIAIKFAYDYVSYGEPPYYRNKQYYFDYDGRYSIPYNTYGAPINATWETWNTHTNSNHTYDYDNTYTSTNSNLVSFLGAGTNDYAGIKEEVVDDWIGYQHNLDDTIDAYMGNVYSGNDDLQSIASQYNNKTIKIGNDYYKVHLQYIEMTNSDVENIHIPLIGAAIGRDVLQSLNDNSSLSTYQKVNSSDLSNNTKVNNSTTLFVQCHKVTAYMEQITQPTITIQLKGVNNHNSMDDVPELIDSPYCMFAIPYFNEWYTETDLGKTYNVAFGTTSSSPSINYKVNNNIALGVAQYIVHNIQPQVGGEGSLIDLQLLPYCPFDFNMINGIGNVSKTLFVNTGDFQLKKVINTTDNSVVCGIVFALSPDFKHNGVCFDGSSSLNVELSTVMDTKTSNQCDLYRLYAPSKAKYYDFSAAKNRGLSEFEICATYKPYSPFIYVRPVKNTGSLYGPNFNDYNGLIATGDYTIPIETDAWKQYEISNKNYQKIFDRQVQHQTFINDWAEKEQAYAGKASTKAATVGSVISGGFAGASIGAKLGSVAGPYGAIIGGVAGGLAGAVGLGSYANDLTSEGAKLDMDKLIATNAENISYMKDMFTYNLQNIQALPDTLIATSGFDYINKIYPFIEYYTCTDVERQQVQRLFELSGMEIGRVDYINNFNIGNSQSFTQATLYKFIGEIGNPSIVNEINIELNKGVYL